MEERVQCGTTNAVAYKTQREKLLSVPIPVEAAVNLKEVEEYNQQMAAKSEEQKKEEERERKATGTPEPEPVRPLVPLTACINALCAPEVIQGWYSAAAKTNTHCFKQKRFTTFPEYLILQLGRFHIEGMELKKLGMSNFSP